VGRALAELGPAAPEDLVVATKVGRVLRKDAPPDPTQMKDGRPIYVDTPDENPVFDFSAAGVRESVESSLERLGRDHLDIVHLHDPDDHFDQALGEAYPALVELRDAGVIRAISVGMNQAEMLVRFAEAARFDCFLLAGRYTLLDSSGAAELLPLCAERQIGVLIGGVFNSGILADPSPGSRYDYGAAPAEVLERAQAIAGVCERHGVSLKAAALQFPFGHPAVTSVLIGARSRQELEENLALVEAPIPAALWDELCERSLLDPSVPVPAGEAG
jgi:D-threo-aldose 1-dehydrogenase